MIIVDANPTTSQRNATITASHWGTRLYIYVTQAAGTIYQTVTFEPNGGTCPKTSQSYPVGGSYSPFPAASRDGYAFEGWFTEETGGSRVYEWNAVTSASARTLYAHWEKAANLVFHVLPGWNGSPVLSSEKGSRVPDTSFEIGTPFYLSYCYRNAGTSNAPAHSVSVSLYKDGQLVDGTVLGSPACGMEDLLGYEDMDITVSEAGSYSVKVALDSENAVAESDESDNIATLDFVVTAPVPKQTVSFNAGEGTCSTGTKGYAYGGKYSPLPVATREGYVFAGWFTAADGGTEVTENTAVTTAFVRTLYAHWLDAPDLAFEFDLLDGWSRSAFVTSTTNSVFPEGNFPVGLPVYLNFNYINRSGDLAAPAHAIAVSLYDETGRKLGTQILRQPELARYFDDSGSFNPNCQRQVLNFNLGEFGSAGTYIAKITLDSDNEVDEGTANDRRGENDNERTVEFTIREDQKFVRVAFDYCGGTGTTETVQYMCGSPYGAFPEPLARTGYDWQGWWTSTLAGGSKVAWSNEVTELSPRTLYARWKAKSYKVSLHNGSGDTTSVTATFGSSMPPIMLPSRAGYVFTGYYYAGYYDYPNHSGIQYYSSNGSSLRTWDIPQDSQLEARWTPTTTTITFYRQGGTGGSETATATYDEAYPKVLVPSRTGYVFKGYFSEPNGGGIQYYTDVKYADGTCGAFSNPWTTTATHLDLYANWAPLTCGIKFDRQSGTEGQEEATATYGSALPPIDVPSRAGYDFGGYYTAADGRGTQYYDAAGQGLRDWDIASSATTLYAKWTAKTKAKTFGTGKTSTFEVPGDGTATLVGVSGVTWGDFAGRDSYGMTTFVNANIIDAEKTAKDDADDYWCYAMSDMNALYYTGWAKKTKYATVDDMKDSFNASSLRGGTLDGVSEGKYGMLAKYGGWGGLFAWYKDATGIDLAAKKALTEGCVDASFLSTLRRLMDDGGHVVRINVYFADVLFNEKWKGFSVSHGVLCVGYVADGNTLNGLFIVDPDNDMYTGAGGRAAPNSILYCPVLWENFQVYSIYGVWGQIGTIMSEYRALASMPAGEAAKPSYKVAFNANGGTLPKGKTMAAQTMVYGKAAALRKNVFTRTGHVFAGWATSAAGAKKGVIAYANAQNVKNLRTDGKTTTLYAVWAKKTYKVKFVANGGTGKMAVESFVYGKAKKLSANKFKAPKGKKFKGWATSKANAKKGKVAYRNKKAVKNLVTTGKTVNLYAVWTK